MSGGGRQSPPPQGSSVEGIERLLETAGMALLRLGQGLEPVGDFVEAFLARRTGHTGVHIRVLIGLTDDRGLQVQGRLTDRLTSRRIANLLQVLEMPVRMAGLALRGRTENGRNIVIAFDVCLLSKVEVAAIRSEERRVGK